MPDPKDMAEDLVETTNSFGQHDVYMKDPKDMTDNEIAGLLVTDGGVNISQELKALRLAREINSLGWPDLYDGLGVNRQTGETQTAGPISDLPKGRSGD